MYSTHYIIKPAPWFEKKAYRKSWHRFIPWIKPKPYGFITVDNYIATHPDNIQWAKDMCAKQGWTCDVQPYLRDVSK